MTERDEELGRALRELRAPPHGEGFEDRLHTLLEDEAARRRTKKSKEGLSLFRKPFPALAGAAALAAAIVLVIALVPGGSERIGPQPAQAAQIVDRARAALADARSLRATLVVRERLNEQEPMTLERLRVAMTARGDLRVLGSTQDGNFYYSARNGREVQLDLPYDPGAFVTEGVAPGAPDGLIGDRRLGLQQAAVTRALAAARSGDVGEDRINGRRAWVLRAAIPVNKLGFSGNRLVVVVDQATGFPLSVREERSGELVRGFELRDLELNPSISQRAFAPNFPATATVVNEGFVTVPFEEAAEGVDYAPLAPGSLPRGYERAETRIADTTPSPTGNEAMNPPSEDVVSTAYRSGLDRIIVSTRRTGEDPAAWQDPIASGEGNLVEPERVRLTAGALRGATANIVIDPRVEPHLYVVTDERVVTITGPLTREQLLAAANSLGS